MAARQLVTLAPGEDGAIHITDTGRRAYLVVLSTDGRIANQALTGFTPREIAEFAGYLRQVIRNTNTGNPEEWTLFEKIERLPADET
jgi:hypothetical protein